MRFSIEAVDAHTQGDASRVIFGGGVGVLAAPGATMFEKMRYFETEADWLRRLMLREPRGSSNLCCNLIMPPTDARAAAGFIILEQQDYYAAMSGTNTIAVATVLLETGQIEMVEPVTEFYLEPPAGLVLIRAHCKDGRVLRVDFQNVPSFASVLDAPLDVAGYGRLTVSVAFGGMAYVLADAEQLGMSLDPGEGLAIQAAAAAICEAANVSIGFSHPENPDLTMIEGLILYREASGTGRLRQVPVNAGSSVGRTPAGTGVSAMAAVLHARGACRAGDTFEIDGMLNNPFHCRILEETSVGGVAAIVPEIGGRAWITGHGRYVLQDDDPFPEGFMVADLWPMAKPGSPAARMAGQRRLVSGHPTEKPLP
ncbi:MAG: proline racemase family protein [Rhizobiaceae bacterium]|nr:proline racemase family protein [Rhizobiaceae bacterium]